MESRKAKARVDMTLEVLAALANRDRQWMLAYLLEAGTTGLRASELAAHVGMSPDLLRKHLIVLEQALLVQNQVGRDERGVFSRYFMTDFGREWIERIDLVDDDTHLLLTLKGAKKAALPVVSASGSRRKTRN